MILYKLPAEAHQCRLFLQAEMITQAYTDVLMLRHKHTRTQTVTHHLNNIFHSCCSSQWPPMWLLCVDMCEKCGHENRHGCTWTQKHLYTQQISLCGVMSPHRKSPLHPVILRYPMSTIRCPLT